MRSKRITNLFGVDDLDSLAKFDLPNYDWDSEIDIEDRDDIKDLNEFMLKVLGNSFKKPE